MAGSDKPDQKVGRGHDAPSPPAGEAPAEGGIVEAKKEFIQTFFKRAEEFTETLLRENERLRYRILELEEQLLHGGAVEKTGSIPGSGPLRELVTRIEALEQE